MPWYIQLATILITSGIVQVPEMLVASKNLPIQKFKSNRNPNHIYSKKNNDSMGSLKSELMACVSLSGKKFEISEETRLRYSIFEDYEFSLRPVVNSSTPTLVSVSLSNLQVMGLDEQNQIMISNALVVLKWDDEYLSWNPKNFSNITRMVVSASQIWTPDIVLFNSADSAYSHHRETFLIDVEADGSVTWMFPEILRSYCRVDIRYFPFDRQSCVLEFQSWSRNRKELSVFHGKINPFINHTHINTEWEILNMTVHEREDNSIVYLEFIIVLKRNNAFYVNHMILPFTVLSSLTLFVFWLPPDSGEKITLIITILLTLTVFLQFITEYTPKSAKEMPLIGIYFNLNLMLVLISVFLTIIILTLHFRGPKTKRVPKWMRKLFIGRLGKMLCLVGKSELKTRANTSKNLTASTQTNQIVKRSFEIAFIKLLNSLDADQLNDSKLKCMILKEIIDCQMNLIDGNDKEEKKSSNQLAQNKINKIYDEWKMVAMVMDRVCFFIYLPTFVLITALYLYFN